MWEKIKKHSAKIISAFVSILLVIGGVAVIKNREESKNNAEENLAGEANSEENQTAPTEEAAQVSQPQQENSATAEYDVTSIKNTAPTAAPATTAPTVTKNTSTSSTTTTTTPKAKTKTKSS